MGVLPPHEAIRGGYKTLENLGWGYGVAGLCELVAPRRSRYKPLQRREQSMKEVIMDTPMEPLARLQCPSALCTC